MSWTIWLRVAVVTLVLVPFVQAATRFWARRVQVGGRHLRVLEACALGNDGRVYLVEVAGRVYALAAGAKGFQVVGEVNAPEVLLACAPGEGVGGGSPAVRGWAEGWLSRAAGLWRQWLGYWRRPGDQDGRETGDLQCPSSGRASALGVLEEQVARVRRLSEARDEGVGTFNR